MTTTATRNVERVQRLPTQRQRAAIDTTKVKGTGLHGIKFGDTVSQLIFSEPARDSFMPSPCMLINIASEFAAIRYRGTHRKAESRA
jgi:hypothetical protein